MVRVSDELALMTRRYPTLTIPVAVLSNATRHLIEGGHMIPVTMADKITSVIEHAAARV